MAQMMNATLENYETQCNSRHFTFPRRTVVEVPDQYAQPLLKQLKAKGVFIIPTTAPMGEDGKPVSGWDAEKAKKDAEWDGLLQYKNGRLRARINNFIMQKDEFQKRGITLQPDPAYLQAVKWDEEISKHLNTYKPIREDLSYDEFFGKTFKEGEEISAGALPKKGKGRGRPKQEKVDFNTTVEANGTT